MRRAAFASVLISITLSSAFSYADEASDARALAQKAVLAHGGADPLAKTQRMVRSSTGTMFLFGQPSAFRDELTVALPSKFRLHLAGGAAGPQNQMLIILNGNDAWHATTLGVTLLPKDRLAELQDEGRVMWYATLVPLIQDKSLHLAPIAPVNVNGRPTSGISVNQAGKSEISLYFDAQTNLLVKAARKSQDGGIPVEKEYFYADHQLVDGVLLPTKYSEFTGGRKFVDVNSISYKFPPRTDDKLFEKP
ncbi:hypothetical protein BH10PLA2_BH10PLA2_25100 [soil metagenome]